MKIQVSEIIVGKRLRKDVGDLTDLITSISRHGLLNPITLTYENELIAGFRRLEAVKALGWDEIECVKIAVEDRLQQLLIEAEENLTRKDFTPEEVEVFDELYHYYSSRGFQRFRLWLGRMWLRFRKWVSSLFSKE